MVDNIIVSKIILGLDLDLAPVPVVLQEVGV